MQSCVIMYEFFRVLQSGKYSPARASIPNERCRLCYFDCELSVQRDVKFLFWIKTIHVNCYFLTKWVMTWNRFDSKQTKNGFQKMGLCYLHFSFFLFFLFSFPSLGNFQYAGPPRPNVSLYSEYPTTRLLSYEQFLPKITMSTSLLLKMDWRHCFFVSTFI